MGKNTNTLARPWSVDLAQPQLRVESWGRAVVSSGRVVRATHPDTLRRVFELANKEGRSVAVRGAGNSYNDAFHNNGGLVLDTAGMDAVADWDTKTGIVKAGPGMTLAKMWRSTLQDGFWPPVVTGTMFASFGGLAAMNAHGKNNFKQGTFGQHILEFTILLPTGEELTCSPSQNADLYYAAIGGFGTLGCFTSITLRMKKVHSGLLEVEEFVTRNLSEAFDCFEHNKNNIDYFVGWFDAFAAGGSLGRGVIHTARYLHEGEDPRPLETLNPSSQELPERILGFPKAWMWILLRPFVNDRGMQMINLAKYLATRTRPDGHKYKQSLAAFSFLLDYVPNWKLSYGPGGLIQYQSFIPKDKARDVYHNLIALSQEHGIVPYLLVFKRHRPDPFLLTHAVDGYSLAMDYRVTAKNRAAVWNLAHEMDEIVHKAGGRFYFAKDATLQARSLRRIWPKESIDQFLNLKKRCDPNGILQTDLYRRIFGEVL